MMSYPFIGGSVSLIEDIEGGPRSYQRRMEDLGASRPIDLGRVAAAPRPRVSSSFRCILFFAEVLVKHSKSYEAMRKLVDGRTTACPIADATRRRYEGRPLSDVLTDLKEARDARQKTVLGLLAADLQLAMAETSGDSRELDRAVFRLGQHYKAIAVNRRESGAHRLCSAIAASQLIQSLRYPPSDIAIQLEEIEEHLSGESASWIATAGLSSEAFSSAIDDVRAVTRTIYGQSASGANDLIVQAAKDPDIPTWVRLSQVTRADQLAIAQSPWDDVGPADLEGSDNNLVRATVSAILKRDFEMADGAARALGTRLGKTWAPSHGVEDRSTWRTLRAAHHLGNLGSSSPSDRRLNALSAYELLVGVNLDAELIGELIDAAVEGLDPYSDDGKKDWAITYGRILSVSDHEDIAPRLSNADRAHLRNVLVEELLSASLDCANFVELANELRGFRRSIDHDLFSDFPNQYLGKYRSMHSRLRQFLLLQERDVADQVEVILRKVSAAESQRQAEQRISAFLALDSDIAAATSDVRAAGSGLLHSILLPALQIARDEITEARRQAEQVSRPDLRFILQSDRLPLQGSTEYDIPILLDIQNVGNVTARDLILELGSRQARTVVGEKHIAALRPGETLSPQFVLTKNEPMQHLVIDVVARWTDDLGQVFNASVELMAEAERPSRWSLEDVNPYRLAPVRNRDRLFGRDRELESLRGRLSAGESVFLTGQKRVGKSSLAQVALEDLKERGVAAQRVPLGYLQADTTSELIQNILTTIYELLEERIGSAVPSLPEMDDERAANTAGRWLTRVTSQIPPELHVVLAIDDFDELPRQFFEADEGSVLFVFLRALVEEPWLAIVFIGSEIMPNLMRSHGYKLNQVSRLDVGKIEHPESTARLLREPSSNRFEWSDGAIQTAHVLTGGNPYFATLLAHEVWERLHSRERSFAGEVDIDECIQILASTAEQDHLVHLWADGPTGIDPTSDVSTQNAAILFAVAKCASDDDSASRDEVIDYAALRSGTESRGVLSGRLDSLIERRVLTEVGDHSVRLDIPFVQMWFDKSASTRLGSQLRALIEASREAAYIADRDLLAVSQDLFFGGESVSEIRVRDWLNQFQDIGLRIAAFRMLKRLKDEAYFNDGEVVTIGHQLRPNLVSSSIWKQVRLKANQTHTSNVRIVCPFGHDVPILERLATALRIPKDDVMSVKEIMQDERLGQEPTIVIVATTFDGQMGETVDTVRLVRDRAEEVSGNLQMACLSIASTEAKNVAHIDGVEYPRFIGAHLGSRLQPFSSADSCFGDDEAAEVGREKFLRVGGALNPHFPLGWPPDGVLLLFPGYVPSFCPPVFWCSGRYMGTDWHPLFEGETVWGGSWPEVGSEQATEVRDLIRRGECESVEFKSSLRTEVPGGTVSKALELVVAKTVAGFLNAAGGTLLIGVADDRSILGLKSDYESSANIAGADGFERHLFGVLNRDLDALSVGDVGVSFVNLGGEVCRIECRQAVEPVWAKKDGVEILYVREGNRTREVSSRELAEYVRRRWSGRKSPSES